MERCVAPGESSETTPCPSAEHKSRRRPLLHLNNAPLLVSGSFSSPSPGIFSGGDYGNPLVTGELGKLPFTVSGEPSGGGCSEGRAAIGVLGPVSGFGDGQGRTAS